MGFQEYLECLQERVFPELGKARYNRKTSENSRKDVYDWELENASPEFNEVYECFSHYSQHRSLINKHDCVESIVEHFGLEESDHENLMMGEPFDIADIEEGCAGQIIVEVKRHYDLEEDDT